ncbi:MAG: hypothetical protein ABH863_03625 [Candidatus Micrarchaeota archaeon]
MKMPIMDDDFAEADAQPRRTVCDLCGSPMYRSGGCHICTKCGQKKCNTDLT